MPSDAGFPWEGLERFPLAAASFGAVFVSPSPQKPLAHLHGSRLAALLGLSVCLSVSRPRNSTPRTAWLKARGEPMGRFPPASIQLGSSPGAGAGLRHPLAPWMARVTAITSGTPSLAHRCLCCAKPSWLLGSCKRRIPRRKVKAVAAAVPPAASVSASLRTEQGLSAFKCFQSFRAGVIRVQVLPTKQPAPNINNNEG